jgi:ribosomal protein L29
VRTLYQRFEVTKKQGEQLKKKLRELGYDVSYGDLRVASYDAKPKQVTEFDAQSDEKKRALATLKRSYVIRLFADHADTQSLFGSLAKDLERLVG